MSKIKNESTYFCVRMEANATTQILFYIFGIAGLIWTAWWERILVSARKQDPKLVTKLEADKSQKEAEKARKNGTSIETPWRAFMRSNPVRALTYVHFCNNW